jgi:urea transport system ATP-binding protein
LATEAATATAVDPLKVDHLSVSYGQSQVIPDLSFSVRANEIVAVMGRNGMGKTTLLKAMIGLLPVRAGRVGLCGQDITGDEPYDRVAKGLGYVPQGRMIFPALTVKENIEAGLRTRKESVPQELYEFFPVLQEMKGRRGGNLSGGQQQQLAIARALASRPKVLLLDEPTEGIQPSIIKELAEILRRIRDKWQLAVLVSEQVLSFALSVADRILVIDRGRIVEESPRSQIDSETLGKLLSV